jgi:hypothetical protein
MKRRTESLDVASVEWTLSFADTLSAGGFRLLSPITRPKMAVFCDHAPLKMRALPSQAAYVMLVNLLSLM